MRTALFSRPFITALLKCFPYALILMVFFACEKNEKTVLVFSKTQGFRHGSIEVGVAAIKKLGQEHGFKVTATEDAAYFVEDSLRHYAAVVFLNTTQEVLNAVQQADFERYIQAGGGFVGIHAATDTEYDWPWYTKLVGAVFDGHPQIQEAKLQVVNQTHVATKHLDSVWMKSDEWYNFRTISPDINVLITIDETSYEGGTNGKNHPISWFHDFDGGRSFYTEMGHTDETYQDPLFLAHLLGGIEYAMGNNKRDYALATIDRVPPEDRFVKKVLDFNLNEPMELDEIPGKGIVFIERRGAIKLFDFKTGQTSLAGELNVFYGNEDGLLGVAVDPNFEKNNWIYLLYSAPGEKSQQHISRFEFIDDKINLSSEKLILVVPTDRHCCHSGGALEFGPDGHLFIALGDNTNPFESSGFAPIDEREGRQAFDAQRSAGNTNDLRGKILRIKPQDDGSYTIPEGNLFPVGTPNTRPEIYVMGCRNPFRHSIDSKTGYLYWGDVGPDAGKADPDRGPSGMGEFDQARTAGFWGWPYTRGYNEPYNDFDFTTGKSGPKFDPYTLINDSPNNTGLQKLPPAKASMIPMTYFRSEEFPWMGDGGINPMAGPVFHAANYPNAQLTFPTYFEDKLFLYEWMRDWIYVITLDENQNYVKADPFMPNTEFSHPMDMVFASDGKLYVLEYGQKWTAQNLDARLSSITYLDGNREPVAKISADKAVGSAPLKVKFDGTQSYDFDNDPLTYAWYFTDNSVQAVEGSPEFIFEKNGTYDVRLTVTDVQGNATTTNSKILVGNDPPVLTIDIEANDSLYWDKKTLNYAITVTDEQDGNSANGTISAEDIKVTFDYIAEGKDMIAASTGHQKNVDPKGKTYIENSDCKACHAPNEKVNGPSYMDIAQKYSANDKGYLVSKIIKGGGGVWGESAMAAHPQLTVEEVAEMVDYMLSLKPKVQAVNNELPLKGTLTFDKHLNSPGEGIYVLMASYRDKGSTAMPNAELMASDQRTFKSLKIEAENAAAKSEEAGTWSTSTARVVGPVVDKSFLRFNDMALKNMKALKLATFYNGNYKFEGEVYIREGAPDGPIIGQTVLGHYGDEKMGYYEIPVQPNSEKNTLYLVFANPKNPRQNIAHIDWISPVYQR